MGEQGQLYDNGQWLNWGGDHFVVYTDAEIQYCIPETYIINKF